MKETWKRQILMVQFKHSIYTQYERELIMSVHSLKKENKELVAEVKLLHT